MFVVAVSQHVDSIALQVVEAFWSVRIPVVNHNGLNTDAGGHGVEPAFELRQSGEPGHTDVGVVSGKNREDYEVVFSNTDSQLYAQFPGKVADQFVVVPVRGCPFLVINRRSYTGNNVQGTFVANFLKGSRPGAAADRQCSQQNHGHRPVAGFKGADQS